MNRRNAAIGILTVTVLVTAVAMTSRRFPSAHLWGSLSEVREQKNPILTPCSRFTEGFSDLSFDSWNFDEWAQTYHQKVGEIVEEHLGSFSSPAKCDAATGGESLPAGPKLAELAQKLPSWRSRPASQTEVGSVLLEYLRAYECALEERIYFLHPDALEFLRSEMEASGSASSEIYLSQIFSEASAEDDVILHERATARPTLERTLATVAGLVRLLPLNGELQCIERTSLDIRNALALSAEASACLPRIWNTKDPLRDLAP